MSRSIYDHITHHLGPDGTLDDSGTTLPDEDAYTMASGMRWSPGAMDGAMDVFGAESIADQLNVVIKLLGNATKRQSKKNLVKLHDALATESALSLVDPLIQEVIAQGIDRDALHEVAKWLCVSGTDRGAVKVGIALLGVCGLDGTIGIVRTLGAHDEFTLFSAVALANGAPHVEVELWSLAKRVHGWGRIHCVERLAGTTNPEIKEWILREGFRNDVTYEYLAYTAATTGDLYSALHRDNLDRPLLTAASEILQALSAGGPGHDLDDLERGVDLIERYLAVMYTQARELCDLLAVAAIAKFLHQPGDWEQRSTRGWTATRCEAFEQACATIMQRGHWEPLIIQSLQSPDPQTHGVAVLAARQLQVDTFEHFVQQLERDPCGTGWYDAWLQADHSRAVRLVELAQRCLPLEQVASGPASELGIGPEFRVHQALDWTLQELRRFPGVGGELLIVGLQSPAIRNRVMSLKALADWPVEYWPQGAAQLLAVTATSDPHTGAREMARELIQT